MPNTQFRTALVAVALAVSALLAAPAVQAQTDVTGVWEITITTPTGPNTLEVSFKQQGGTITGDLTSALGNAPFKGTIAGDALTVVAAIDIQGTALQLTFNAKVTENTLGGNVKFGDLGEAPFEGKRKTGGASPTAAAGSAAGINGEWSILVNLQGVEVPLAATFKQEGARLTGTFTSDQGTMNINGTMTGNSLKAEFLAPTPNGNLPVVMTGDLSPSGSMPGKMNITGLGEADWVAKRK